LLLQTSFKISTQRTKPALRLKPQEYLTPRVTKRFYGIVYSFELSRLRKMFFLQLLQKSAKQGSSAYL